MSGAIVAAPEEVTVAVIGSGFSGLGMAWMLRQRGIDDFVLIERAASLGGTWRDNIYPGCACDVPSHLYSFSFARSADWSRKYGMQPEIRAYLERCADEWDLRGRLRFDAEITAARFDDADGRWHLAAADGRRWIARFVVFGVGGLKDPLWPRIPGRETFAGPVVHSARWDPDLDLAGKRVGVIGTGASAIQIVPAIAPEVAQLTVFQRTPPWVIPRGDRPYGAATRWIYRNVPGLLWAKRTTMYLLWELRHPIAFARRTIYSRLLERLVKYNIRRLLPDPAEAAKASPDYALGCKRILLSDDWYPALARPNVSVEVGSIAEIVPEGVRLKDGTRHDFDVLVCCTGYTVDRPLGDMRVTGRDGADLLALWGDRPRAHLGITMSGFPNAFVLLGPNTALGHTSVLVMMEAQMRYAAQAIGHVLDRGAKWVDVKSEALDAFVEQMDAAHRDTVWNSGCASWYLSGAGVNYTLWPGTTLAYRRATRRFDPALHTFG